VTFAAPAAYASKVADCHRGGCLTPPIPTVSTPLHCRAASDPLRWLALSFRCFPPLELSETGGMNRTCHASCSCHEPRQFRPLKRKWFGKNHLRVFRSFSAPLHLHRISLFALTSPFHRGAFRGFPLKTTPTSRPCFTVFLEVKGERPKPNSRTQKKDHENEYTKSKIRTQEPTRTVEHGTGQRKA
jgi:hypothetical protein